MAHFVRPLALADGVDAGKYEVHFYAPARLGGHLKGRAFETGVIETMPGEEFLRNLAKARPMFPAEVIRRYVAEDRGIIQRVKPDLVIGDMRPSLAISCALEKVPSAAMMNGYWSPYNTFRPEIFPELGWVTRVFGPGRFGWIYRKLEPGAIKRIVAPTNVVRVENGLPPLPADLRALYNAADYVLYPDIPEFVETAGLPETHQYVGICEWTPETTKPEWWGKMVADPKRKVFVSLGSSGPLRVLPGLLRALGRLPVSVVVASSGREMPAMGAGVYVAKLLPFTETAELSAVVVSHGGSGGLYPAMAAGTPVLGIPSNGDQHMSTAFLEHAGAGLGVRVEEATEGRLFAALERLLNEKGFGERARYWKGVYGRYESGRMFAGFLGSVLARGKTT